MKRLKFAVGENVLVMDNKTKKFVMLGIIVKENGHVSWEVMATGN